MQAHELRKKYIDFFVSKGHVAIPSASLIPENDPSVLFTTAGMHPLVPYLLGAKHPSGNRLVNAQKCMRTGDIDEVGDATHFTFFEMLGNWSLGDYFKDDSIRWSFEFLTAPEWLHIPLERLAVSVFSGDDDAPRDEESARIWKECGVSPERIAYLGKDDNWWPAGGKHPGPQGPDTEIFYWVSDDPTPSSFDPQDKRWVELWNNVFMQFEKKDGVLTLLAQKNVDTGMGLERVASVLQNKKSAYETELLWPLVQCIERISGASYENPLHMRSIRIIADHVRASVFVLADRARIVPSNRDQGYILRRLLRRAVRHGRLVGIHQSFLVDIAREVINIYGGVYAELTSSADYVYDQIKQEEDKFARALEKGLKEFSKRMESDVPFSGSDAFELYATFGFPFELTQELIQEKNIHIDQEEFKKQFEQHQQLSRENAGAKFAGGLADDSPKTIHGHTATHLLHQALRTVLGDHVEQKGSNITAERVRFDFSHPNKLTDEEKQKVEDIVNENIKKNLPVSCEILSVDEAKQRGAIGLFEEQYAQKNNQIKMYSIGDEVMGVASREICGGPHVNNTGEIGSFKILKEEAVSSGIRRIKAIVE